MNDNNMTNLMGIIATTTDTQMLDAQVIGVIITTTVIAIIGYFLTRVFKMIDKMDANIDKLGKDAGVRDVKIGIMSSDILNKHNYLNEKIDSINDNMKDLIVEIRILARDININHENNNNNRDNSK
jgi:hypothetical protein